MGWWAGLAPTSPLDVRLQLCTELLQLWSLDSRAWLGVVAGRMPVLPAGLVLSRTLVLALLPAPRCAGCFISLRMSVVDPALALVS